MLPCCVAGVIVLPCCVAGVIVLPCCVAGVIVLPCCVAGVIVLPCCVAGVIVLPCCVAGLVMCWYLEKITTSSHVARDSTCTRSLHWFLFGYQRRWALIEVFWLPW